MRHLLLGMMLALIAVTALAGPGRAQSAADIVFSEIERRLILEYFGHPPRGAPGAKGVPPGLAKKGAMRMRDTIGCSVAAQNARSASRSARAAAPSASGSSRAAG